NSAVPSASVRPLQKSLIKMCVMSDLSVIRIAGLSCATTGKNTADVKKPLLASSAAIRFATSALEHWMRRMADLLPFCSMLMMESNY
ncbi:hypothetical protein, partial [Pseudomonas viridiflava]|uniref:hypothetical protein n=1 Tax=Pseudomonas viridiflava TaxID=33069 RepID=UPI0019D060FF